MIDIGKMILIIVGRILLWLLGNLLLLAILLFLLFFTIKLFGIHDTLLVVCYTLLWCCIGYWAFMMANYAYFDYLEDK